MNATATTSSKAFDPELSNVFLDNVIKHLGLKNDAALSRAMEVAPPVISKIRHGRLPVGAGYIVRIHEMTGWSIDTIKRELGLPVFVPVHLRQQAA